MKGNVTGINFQAESQYKNDNETKQSIYIYPITPYTFRKGSNDYILRVRDSLKKDFRVVNTVTTLGIFDMLLKLHKCDIIYFNWVPDIADKKFGYLQIPVLFFILVLCKLLRIKIAWFIHNDISHAKKNWVAKKVIRRIMMMFSDVAFSHSKELSLIKKMPEIKVFEHPIEEMHELEQLPAPDYDVLIWGSVSPYKGVKEFAQFNYSSEKFNNDKILVAGRFISERFYNNVSSFQKENIQFINKVEDEEELADLFSKSRYVLFCYRSSSVLSSAALCKTLSYGKTIIGPDIGAFKELGRKGLIYTYHSFEDLAELLHELKTSNTYIDKNLIKNYIQTASWECFKDFLIEHLKETDKRKLDLSPVTANYYKSVV